MIVNRFEIWLISLDPTQGSEIAKTRPCLIISPDSANKFLNTVLVAPLTQTRKAYPTRVNCKFASQDAQVALDQMRAVDKDSRLIKKIGVLENITCEQICKTLEIMFQY
ncbi:MAG: type II toxin-antitoxin system PemK/MazF family toxin [Arcicella sp.]|nr:type II toxin-antitoxin system PemK/MazF family toxin [Arcicella sp.]